MSPFDGARARALRLKIGVGIEALAVAAGISPNTLRWAEQGRHQPGPRVQRSIARALGVPLDKIRTRTPLRTLRDRRRHLGLTQAQMAARIGVVRQMVSQVERGVTGVASPEAWAAAYELTPDQWTRAQRASRDQVRQTVTAKARRTRRGQRGEV
ncbi:helix-turn-helix domain-containing protein [Streptomyces griseosporeus]